MSDKKVIAIIQARMTSTRLPGKVMMAIGKRPMLSYMVERARAAQMIDKIVIATSDDSSDDAVSDFCEKEDVLCYRGSLEDVLGRYYRAAKQFNADVIVRLTGDCPLIDPKIIDEVTNLYLTGNYDFVGNTTPPKWTFPIGMDVEVFSFESLRRAWREAKDLADREHVTFYFWKNPDIFSIYRCNLAKDMSNYRLAVDYPQDFKLIEIIISKLYPENPLFTMSDIIDFLKNNPDVYAINDKCKSEGWRSAYRK